MHTDNGPNAEPETSETQHPGTEEPRPPDSEEESGGGDGTGTVFEEPTANPFIGRELSEEEKEQVERSQLMAFCVEGLGRVFEYILRQQSRRAEKSEGDDGDDGQSEMEAPPYFMPPPMFTQFGVEQLLSGERARQGDAKHHIFSIGMGLGSAMAAMGANAMLQDLIWSFGRVSTDLGSIVNAAFGKPREYVPVRVARPPTPNFGGFVYPSPVAPNPAAGLKYGAPFPEEGDESSGQDDYTKLMGMLGDLQVRVDAGVESHDEVKAVFDQFKKLFGEYFAAPSKSAT